MFAQTLKSAAVAACVLAPSLADAQDRTRLRDIVVEAPWASATMSPNRPGEVYFNITNRGPTDITITSLRSSAARDTRFSPNRAMRIPAGSGAAIQPGGPRVVMDWLRAPLRPGGAFNLTLGFDNGGEITVPVQVMGARATATR
jgi:copper(I)-binding protein